MATTITAPECYAHLNRNELLDFINCLLQFDKTGDDADTALGLLRWNPTVTAEELNARRMAPNRPIYRPVRNH